MFDSFNEFQWDAEHFLQSICWFEFDRKNWHWNDV
jgi:hypothetical protein